MDVAPKTKTTPRQRIAQCIRLLGAAERGVRVNAWGALIKTMQGDGSTFTDIGDWVDDSERTYSETELWEYGQAQRAEGVAIGIKIGLAQARAGNGGGGNGHLTLPKPSEMAQFCDDQAGRLKDDKQREFVADMVSMTRRGMRLSLGRLGYLASIYIQIGGKT